VSHLRVAFFTDSFHEVNGVALTSREFVNYARREGIPLLSVHAGPKCQEMVDGSVTTLEFTRGMVRWNLEHDLAIDLLFLRYFPRVLEALKKFAPDVIHITGPGDAGILGALLAWKLGIPLAASWHTNLHQFAGRRLTSFLQPFPRGFRASAASFAESAALDICTWFYGFAKVLFAPNPELVEMLANSTKRPSFLMRRGIDTELFAPARRVSSNPEFVVGYVGRLSPEKNVRLLAEVQKRLLAKGISDCRFLIVGEGSDRPWLKGELQNAELPGVLRGEPLARAYASMDAFVFPSSTDTFGNVVLEAMASGVPPIVMAEGGPKFLVEPGKTGEVVTSVDGVVDSIAHLKGNSALLAEMRRNARAAAERFSWNSVFEQVHRQYQSVLVPASKAARCTVAA
jgi:phosphatidylinositol alpha 1,6-mannosyltransferase